MEYMLFDSANKNVNEVYRVYVYLSTYTMYV